MLGLNNHSDVHVPGMASMDSCSSSGSRAMPMGDPSMWVTARISSLISVKTSVAVSGLYWWSRVLVEESMSYPAMPPSSLTRCQKALVALTICGPWAAKGPTVRSDSCPR